MRHRDHSQVLLSHAARYIPGKPTARDYAGASVLACTVGLRSHVAEGDLCGVPPPRRAHTSTYRRSYERDHQVRLVASLLDIVGDTGVGLPEGLDVHAAESLGWQLVRLLTEQLRGTIALEGHRGTTVTITFPL